VTSLTEVQRMESDMITLQPLFEYKVYSTTPDGKVVGSLEATGLRPTLLKKFERRGIEVPPGLFGLPLGSGETPPAAAERTLVEQEATW
jgi:pilus assembly protein CpaF